MVGANRLLVRVKNSVQARKIGHVLPIVIENQLPVPHRLRVVNNYTGISVLSDALSSPVLTSYRPLTDRPLCPGCHTRLRLDELRVDLALAKRLDLVGRLELAHDQ